MTSLMNQNDFPAVDAHQHRATKANAKPKARVGILGGGTAGSTIAIRLAALGVETYLFEKKASLIDGPPMCHLHAGGNLYREIPDEDCVALLEQCIDIVRLYPYTIDIRPTVFAVPTRDDGAPEDLLPRLETLKNAYQALVDSDINNKVLGEPDNYYQLYSHERLLELAQLPQVDVPVTLDEWMIPVAKYLDLNKVKFPLIAVQEYGWNIFRLAASAKLALDEYPNAHVLTNTLVKHVAPLDCENCSNADHHVSKWRIDYQIEASNAQDAALQSVEVDFLVNAAGFRTGVIDDLVGVSVTRMVEFKSSFVTHWDNAGGQIPEIIIYGERGTPEGMAQLTPYPNGYFQIHGMSKFITLFDDGLVASSETSAQPKLAKKYVDYIDQGWDKSALQARAQQAIDFVAQFVPSFHSARTTQNALFGAQQIPGEDDTLRVADISLYPNLHYARAENVKASSTLIAADEVVSQLVRLNIIDETAAEDDDRKNHEWRYLVHNDDTHVDAVARMLAANRGFPVDMARVNKGMRLAALCSLTPV